MVAVLTAALGIASTLIAWFFNPRRLIYSELDKIYLTLEALYGKRDKALQENNSDMLTVVTADIIKLCNRKAILLQRLR
jgi:hypothetical protein